MQRTLLILGSMPNPTLPQRTDFHDLACANASGYSAAKHHLPTPSFTAMSAILTSGIASGRQSINALRGLETNILYLIPRPTKTLTASNFCKNAILKLRTNPRYFRYRLRKSSYHWRYFVSKEMAYYRKLILMQCNFDSDIQLHIDRKSPSTGLLSLIIGLSLNSYDRYILSGFSFELTHAYANNPEIQQRYTAVSRHKETDIKLLTQLKFLHNNIYTTENNVHQIANIPFI